jgi:archaemetzincin
MKKYFTLFSATVFLIMVALIIYPNFRYKVITEETFVAIQPFGEFSTKEAKMMQEEISEFYHVNVTLLKPIELPKNAYINVKSSRYRADTLIRFLRKNIDSNYDFVIGLTDKDISTTKYSNRSTKTIKEPSYKYADWGIFGLGFMPGKSCIVSTFRLKEKNFRRRFIKICCHELGHNFGLPHCSDKSCIMQDAAETIKTIDNVKLNLCNSCKKKIGFNEY